MWLWLVVAVGIWWIANTVSHQFIHRPFFRHRWANACVGRCLTLLIGVPQSAWRERHLAHHAGVRFQLRWTPALAADVAVAAGIWIVLALGAPLFFAQVYLPGFVAAMLLCAIHGHYEHAGGTTSHYGRLYNLLCMNDGYHVEHHRHPGVSWTRLPALRESTASASRWPAPLRWMDAAGRWGLGALERLVLHSPILQRFVIRTHARAFAALGPALQDARRIAIVGGGLFPRTALVVRELAPAARLAIVDASQESLERARKFLDDTVVFLHARFAAGHPDAYDLVIIPLSFDGDRDAIYARPPAPVVIVHDWIWRRRGISSIVSLLLLKRLNLVRSRAEHAR